MSTHTCEHPPLFNLHSSRPHLSTGSSSASGQSCCLSHTFDSGMHIPSPQSNSVLRSHVFFGIAVWIFFIIKERELKSSVWKLVEKKELFNIRLTYGNSVHHFHLYIQLCLNSGNDRECMSYQHTDIDRHDMWHFGIMVASHHHLAGNLVRHRKSTTDECMLFHPYTDTPLVHMRIHVEL